MPGPRRFGGPSGGPRRGARTTYINGHAINHYAPAVGGKSLSPTTSPMEAYITYTGNIQRNFKYSIQKKGILAGTLIGVRYYLTNSFHSSAFRNRLIAAQRAFELGKIDEHQLAVRKMQAANIYYSYLRKIGYYDDKDFTAEMHLFAMDNGITYNDTNAPHGPSR